MIKKDRVDGIVQNIVNVLGSRLKTVRQRDHEKTYFNLELGCVFLKQNFLEKRIDGAKLI